MEKTWKELQYKLTQTPVLRHSDFNKPFILYININKKGIKVILYQKDEDIEADYMI